jgi:hypothetical protein
MAGRLLTVLRLACRELDMGRRRGVGRLIGLPGAAALAVLALTAPFTAGEALAACTLAAGTYTCTGSDPVSYTVSGGLAVVMDSGTTINAAGNPVWLEVMSGGDLSFEVQAGASIIGTSDIYINNNGWATTADVAGTIEGGLAISSGISSGDMTVTLRDTSAITSIYNALTVVNTGLGDTNVTLSGGITSTGVGAMAAQIVTVENPTTLTVTQTAGSTIEGYHGMVITSASSLTTADLYGSIEATGGTALTGFADTGSGDFAINQYSGTITGASSGIAVTNYGTGDIGISLFGSVISNGNDAIHVYNNLDANNININIGGTAYVYSAASEAIDVTNDSTVGGDTTITVSGDLEAPGTAGVGIAVYQSSLAGDVTINQLAGSITSGGNGISVTNLSSGRTTINLDGTVTGPSSIGVYAQVASGSLGLSISVGTAAVVSGNSYGLYVDAPDGAYIELSGTVTGSDAAVEFTSGNNTLDIHDSAVINGVIDFDYTTGNTINFYTGSYTLAVEEFVVAANPINLRGSAQTLITSGVDSVTGDGDIVVVDTGVTSAVTQGVSAFSTAALNLVGGMIDMEIDRPMVSPGVLLGYADTRPKPNPTDRQIGGADGDMAFDAYGNLAWVRALAAGTVQDGRGAVPGSTSKQAGLLAGVDHVFEDWRLGLFGGGGLARSSLSSGSGSVRSDLGLLGVYARRDFGAVWLDATLAGGFVSSDVSRSVNGGAETARGTSDGWFGTGELALSTKIALAPAWSLAPSLRARYTAMRFDDYSESGSSQDVSYDGHTVQILEQRAETKLVYAAPMAAGLAANYWLKGGALVRETLGADRFDASVVGTDFTVESLSKRTVFGATAGLGFDRMVTANASIFGSIDGAILSDRTRTGSVRGGVKIAF